MSIAIFGGNGFLGSKIAHKAIQNGYKVTSYSRSLPLPQKKIPNVNYEVANVFDSSSYSVDHDIIVHSIGQMFKNSSYKSLFNSPTSLLSMLKGGNPMEKTLETSMMGTNTLSVLTLLRAYESIHRDNKKFVYISADTGLPFTPRDYIRTKRESEYLLSKSSIDHTVIRPGIMYDDVKDGRYLVTQALKSGYEVLGDCDKLQGIVRPVVKVDDVVDCLFDNLDKKLITLEDIVKSTKK